RPKHFQDIMVSVVLKSMVHDHEFAEYPIGSLMHDHFEFESPQGILGRIANLLFVTSYMGRLLVRRNQVLKQLAESVEGNRYFRPLTFKTIAAPPGPERR